MTRNTRHGNSPGRDFFDAEYCQRCHSELQGRITSWFTTDTICVYCSSWEEKIIEAQSESKAELEGIGYIPEVDFEIEWGTEVDLAE